STGIRITVLAGSGIKFQETTFWTGWRCYLDDVELKAVAGAAYPLIVLKTGLGPGLGPDYRKQYYARVGNRFDLVRLEGYDGKDTRNEYYVRHFMCGPSIPRQPEMGWEADLRSADRWRQLRALVWFGGVHWDAGPGGKPDNQEEDIEEVLLVRKLRQRDK